MATADGILVLMGSGETTPTMVTTHQQVFAATAERTGPDVRAGLLDTPYGFQENAREISDRARHYFDHHVGRAVTHVQAADLESVEGPAIEGVLDQVRQLDWLFAGPGSPTYAARQWATGPFTEAFAGIVRRGGTVVMASAAAVTAGTRTVPVYEVYKAGAAPAWEAGLGLVPALLGWRCVVVPHFDNQEGGTHDTRFCYLGERRLRAMEDDLDEGEWVLGIDEHTAAVLDLAAGTMRVEGRGGVHVRRHGEVVSTVPAGALVPLDDLDAADGPVGGPAGSQAATHPQPSSDPRPASLGEEASLLTARFEAALAEQDAESATAAALDLEAQVRAWSADTLDSADVDRAVAALRGMVTRLGRLAGSGLHDHRELVRPHIETLLHVRDDARARRAFEVADHIRGHMDADGVRVQDTREGTHWEWDEPDL